MSISDAQSRQELAGRHTRVKAIPASCNVGPDSTGLLSVEQLATFFNVHTRTVQRWTRGGVIPHYRFGKSVRYDLAEVTRAVASPAA